MPGPADAAASSAYATFQSGGAAQQQRTADNQHPKRLHVLILPDQGSGNDQAIDDGPTESSPQYKTAASASSCGGAWGARTPDAAP